MDYKSVQAGVQACKACGRWKERQCGQAFMGMGSLSPEIVFVGEAPGMQTRVENCVPFEGNKSGDFFTAELAKLGLNFQNCYVTNCVKCQAHGNRTPSMAEQAACLHWLLQELACLGSGGGLEIVAVGSVALEQLNYLGRECWKIPHPSFALRGGMPLLAWRKRLSSVAKEARR